MNADQRRWWSLLERLPQRLGPVRCWRHPGRMDLDGPGSFHPNPTLVVSLAGVVRLRSRGRSCDLRPGQALLIAPGVRHEHLPLAPGDISFAQGFLPAWSDLRFQEHHRTWSGRLAAERSRRLMEAAVDCSDVCRRREAVVELIGHVLREPVRDLRFDHAALGRMVDILWRNLHRGLRVQDLVRASGCSRAQAYRLFTAGYGVPPKMALMQSRLWLAASLLATGLPLAAVAAASGFPSAATLSRAWKRVHGRSPRAAER